MTSKNGIKNKIKTNTILGLYTLSMCMLTVGFTVYQVLTNNLT